MVFVSVYLSVKMIVLSGHLRHLSALARPTFLPLVHSLGAASPTARRILAILGVDSDIGGGASGGGGGSGPFGHYQPAVGKVATGADLAEAGTCDCPICYESLRSPFLRESASRLSLEERVGMRKKRDSDDVEEYRSNDEGGSAGRRRSGRGNSNHDFFADAADYECDEYSDHGGRGGGGGAGAGAGDDDGDGDNGGGGDSEFRVPVVLSPCGHIFCEDCACEWLEKSRLCPLCRSTVDSPLDMQGVSEETLKELASCTGATSAFPYIF